MPVKKHEDEDYVVSGEEEESDEDIDLVQEEEEEDEVEEDEEDAPIAKKSKLSSRSTSKNAAKTKRQSKGMAPVTCERDRMEVHFVFPFLGAEIWRDERINDCLRCLNWFELGFYGEEFRDTSF